jgi:hypothetical protein
MRQLHLVEVPHMVETAVSRVISLVMRMGIQKEVQLMARRRGQWSMVAVVGKFTTLLLPEPILVVQEVDVYTLPLQMRWS